MNRSVFCKRCSDASQGVVAGREAIFRGAAVALAVVLLASNPTVGQAQTIINSGFETSTSPTFPGYLNQAGNSLGTWTTSNTGRAGAQRDGDPAPFANNGAKPEGVAVGFLQAGAVPETSFSNTISGLVAGREYEIRYRVNARAGGIPSAILNVGGTDLVGATVQPVGGTNPYHTISRSFVATGTSMPLTLIAGANNAADVTLLVDDVQVVEKVSPWSVNAWNDDATSGIDTVANTYTHAFNFGNAATGVDTTINGQLFTGAAGGSPSVAGVFSLTGQPGQFGPDANNVVDAGSAALANGFNFNGPDALLTLEGLTDGVTYTTSLFTVGFDDGFRSSTIGAGDDLFTVDVNELGNNNGLRLDYTFVADGTTQSISIDPLEDGRSFHFYGFANATAVAIPEPSSLALLGVTCCGAILRRRRSVS